jgi:hypothetical protein
VNASGLSEEFPFKGEPPHAFQKPLPSEDARVIGPARRKHIGDARSPSRSSSPHVVDDPSGVEDDQIGAAQQLIQFDRDRDP